jgi:hypothetical protein
MLPAGHCGYAIATRGQDKAALVEQFTAIASDSNAMHRIGISGHAAVLYIYDAAGHIKIF